MTTDPEKAPDTPTVVEISFKDGVPCAIDGKEMSYLDIILEMNKISGANGFGRLDMVENRLVGVKSRECYEAPGALAIIKAHKALEDICLERDVLHQLPPEHGWVKPGLQRQMVRPAEGRSGCVPRNDAGQRHGHGAPVLLQGRLHGHGLQSDHSLYTKELATYDEGDTFDHKSAKGFINIYSLFGKVWAEKHRGVKGVRRSSDQRNEPTPRGVSGGTALALQGFVAYLKYASSAFRAICTPSQSVAR